MVDTPHAHTGADPLSNNPAPVAADGPQSPASAAALGGQVRRAVFWRTGTQILSQVISWGATLIVIRLLAPADYGLFAMAQVMMTFLDFLNGYGFASALIQSKEVSKHAIRQALGLAMLMNGSIALLQYSLADHVAAYYGKPEVADILHVLAFIYCATPFIIVPEVMLSRSLEFRKQAIVNLSSAMIAASVSLGCALMGYGVWTLVYAPMALFACRAIGLTIAARLFILPSFDFRGAGSILKFGAAMMGSHLFWVMQSQSDIFIAGRQVSAHQLGLYAEALFLTQLVMSKFVPPLNQVAFPAYSRMQDDRAAVRRYFVNTMQIIMLATAPIFIGIAASARPLVLVLFGEKWLDMAPLMHVLGLAMPLMTAQILFAPVNNALGRPDISMKTSACGAIIFTAAFLFGARAGVTGLTFGWLCSAPVLLGVTIYMGRSLNGVGYRDVLGAIAPAIGCALAMGALVWGLDRLIAGSLSAPLHLGLLIGTGGAFYAALVWMFQRQTLLGLIALIRNKQLPEQSPG